MHVLEEFKYKEPREEFLTEREYLPDNYPRRPLLCCQLRNYLLVYYTKSLR